MKAEDKIKESERSGELRKELREQGYIERWDVRENMTRVTYWNNGAGKSILVIEHAHFDSKSGERSYQSWDIYRQLTSDNGVAKTFAALVEYTTQEVGA